MEQFVPCIVKTCSNNSLNAQNLLGGFIYFVRKDENMSRDKTRVKRALDIAVERLDYVIDYNATPDFVEVTGKMGGDVITYRIYDDGSVYER